MADGLGTVAAETAVKSTSPAAQVRRLGATMLNDVEMKEMWNSINVCIYTTCTRLPLRMIQNISRLIHTFDEFLGRLHLSYHQGNGYSVVVYLNRRLMRSI